jgi:2-dehydropantoate 2-reductase
VRIGIVGAGAIGLSFAAALSTAHDVVLLVRRAEVAAAISRDGIAVAGPEESEFVPVGATADPRGMADRDALIVAVKSFATRDALAPLHGILAPHALIASVQNGIDNAADARAVLPENRVVAGSTMFGAIKLADGHVRPVVVSGATIFERDDSAAPTSDDLAAAFLAAGLDASVVDDIAPVLWRKLIVNATINPLGALARRPNGAIASDPDLSELGKALAQEAGAVARAAGVDVGDPWETAEAAARATAANRNSMLQDLDAGRPSEIEAIAGAIVRSAADHGIAVPLMHAMLRLVRARQRA